MKTFLTILTSLILLSCTKEVSQGAASSYKETTPHVSKVSNRSTSTLSRSKIAIQLLLDTLTGPEYTADGVVAFFDTAFKYTIGNEDSYKFTNPDENLAFLVKGSKLSIDGQPYPQYLKSDTLQLQDWQFRQTSYYLKVVPSNIQSGIHFYLHDTYMNSNKELTTTYIKPFTVNSTAKGNINRFYLIISNK